MAKGSNVQSPEEFISTVGTDAGTSEVQQPSGGTTASSDNGPAIIDPKSLGDGNGSESDTKRGRGRPKGSGKKQEKRETQEKHTLALDSLNSLLFSVHLFLSKGLQAPELELDEDEAKKLAEAVANVARHYNVGIPQKTLDWYNLAAALSTVYGLRAFAIIQRKKEEKMKHAEKVQPKTGTE